MNKLDTVQISEKGDGLINGLDQSIEKRISSEKEVALRLFKTSRYSGKILCLVSL